jgi:hypothetical protein
MVFGLLLILSPSFAGAVQITLAWDPNDEPDVAGYIVYYGTQSGAYDFDVDVGNYDSVTISGLEKNMKYYLAVTAYDIEGNESDFSDEIVYPNSPSSPSSGGSGVSGGGGGGGCFISSASQTSLFSGQSDPIIKFALIPLVISLLLTALLSFCVALPRRRQQ